MDRSIVQPEWLKNKLEVRADLSNQVGHYIVHYLNKGCIPYFEGAVFASSDNGLPIGHTISDWSIVYLQEKPQYAQGDNHIALVAPVHDPNLTHCSLILGLPRV